MLRKIGIGLLGLLALLILLSLLVYLLTMVEPAPDGSVAEAWLEPGPYSVATVDRIFIDQSRSTNENRDAPDKPERTLTTSIWYPQDINGDAPLIIHSHGFVSSRTDLGYAAEHLASYGFIVAAADYPLTNGAAEGGPNANDVINQPKDVSFLIDSILALCGSEKPFPNNIDENRIGVMGYSLGGLTTSIASFDSRLRDSRIRAAASIAGPSAPFTSRYYQSIDLPFLMIAGTLDALIDYEANAAIIPERIRTSALVRIEGGTHLGFAGMSEPMLRLMNHPDGLGCTAVMSNMDEDPYASFLSLGNEQDGIYMDPSIPEVCETMPTEKALHPARQQMITRMALVTFFQAILGDSEAIRNEAYEAFATSLAADLPEATTTIRQ